jgi:type VII secretion protein EccB
VHSRRDQVEAHAFVVGRMRSALVRAEPDAAQRPLRRTGLGLLIGLLIGGLLVGGAAALAALSPGSSPGWRKAGTLIVERQTGNRYVLDGGSLHPVMNYASARLMLGAKMTVDPVSSKTIAAVPRGGQVGISGAPDTLPSPSLVGAQPWLACAAPVDDSVSRPQPGVTLLLGSDAAPGVAAPSAGALVRGPDGWVYLVAGGKRMHVDATWVLKALDLASVPPTSVTASWLDTLPAGPDLGSLPIKDRGQGGPELGGLKTAVGQVLKVSTPTAADRYYAVVLGGLMPLDDTELALLLGDPATAGAYPHASAHVVDLSPTGLASAALVTPPAPLQALPPLAQLRVGNSTGQVPCVLVGTGAGTPSYAVKLLTPPDVAAATPVLAGAGAASAAGADKIGVPAGGGALVRPLGAGAGTLYLVVESGAKYPLSGDDAATALGFTPGDATAVPAALLGMLPTGPLLQTGGGEAGTTGAGRSQAG